MEDLRIRVSKMTQQMAEKAKRMEEPDPPVLFVKCGDCKRSACACLCRQGA